jgi:hypothetical protein
MPAIRHLVTGKPLQIKAVFNDTSANVMVLKPTSVPSYLANVTGRDSPGYTTSLHIRFDSTINRPLIVPSSTVETNHPRLKASLMNFNAKTVLKS